MMLSLLLMQELL